MLKDETAWLARREAIVATDRSRRRAALALLLVAGLAGGILPSVAAHSYSHGINPWSSTGV